MGGYRDMTNKNQTFCDNNNTGSLVKQIVLSYFNLRGCRISYAEIWTGTKSLIFPGLEKTLKSPSSNCTKKLPF